MSVDTKIPRKDLSDLLCAYALRLHAAAGDQHHIVSPLGAWLLIALAAPVASGKDLENLERVLGSDVERARLAAEMILLSRHPELAVAFAAWHRGDIGSGLEAWRTALPHSATTGPMPTQAQADSWAREHTKGQIQSMPVAIDENLRVLLATAVATEVGWRFPFELVPVQELGGPWASRVKRVMRRDWGGDVVAKTEAAGLVGVSHESSRDGLEVVSVIAAPDLQPARVIAAAYEVAAAIAGVSSRAAYVDAFDLPDRGHAWIARERKVESVHGDRIARSEVTIPAWTAETELDKLIGAPGTGFSEIANAILEQLPPIPPGTGARAIQTATARFDTNGFSAAAVTAMSFVSLAAEPKRRRKVIERTIEVRFDRPFAAVAMTTSERHGRTGRLWGGLPAFGAWVTEPMEPSEPSREW